MVLIMVLVIQILKSCPNHLISFDLIVPPALPIFSVLAEVDLNQGKQHQRWPQGWVGDITHIFLGWIQTVSSHLGYIKMDSHDFIEPWSSETTTRDPMAPRSTHCLTTSCWWKAQLSKRARRCGEIQVNEIHLNATDDGMGKTWVNQSSGRPW